MSIERMNMSAFHPEVPTAYEYIDGQCNTYPQTPLVPQTFGEELSYYETLVLMNKKINEIIDSINSGATLNVETTTTSTTADYATNSGTATSTNYANKASVAKCAEMAKVADYANEAGNAKKADRATIADNVTHSSTSDYATTAGSASTSTTATYATSAGYANSCNNADEADEADYAKNAGKLNGHSSSYYVANPMTTAGDIIVSGNGGVPERLVKGNDGQVLKIVNGSIVWASSGTSTITTKGDLIIGDNDGEASRLGIGTNGQTLKVVNGKPAWQTVASASEVVQSSTTQSADTYKLWYNPSSRILKCSNGGLEASWSPQCIEESFSHAQIDVLPTSEGAVWTQDSTTYVNWYKTNIEITDIVQAEETGATYSCWFTAKPSVSSMIKAINSKCFVNKVYHSGTDNKWYAEVYAETIPTSTIFMDIMTIDNYE